MLGLSDYPFAVIEHPISSASGEALRRRAEAALDQGLACFVRA